MIDLRSLEIFVWIAQLGGFRAAAEKLNTTQPAVSQRIAGLEEQLGVKLFSREARKVALTPEGRAFLTYAERMLRLRSEMLQSVKGGTAFRGTIRIGVAETLVHTILGRLIERAHAAFPAVSIDVEVDTSRNLRDALVASTIDLAFLLGPVSEPRVRNIDVVRYPLGWVARPGLLAPGERLTLAHFERHPAITYTRDTRPHIQLRETLHRMGLRQPRIFGTGSLSTIVRMCRDGIGLALIPPAVIRDDLGEGAAGAGGGRARDPRPRLPGGPPADARRPCGGSHRRAGGGACGRRCSISRAYRY